MAKTERSPNYPQHSLPASVEFARLVYSKEGMGEAPNEIVARALGNESLNGSARVKIASMKQFGLLEGRGEKLRLTDRAFQMLESPDSEEVSRATAAAAYSPPLFADIHANKPEASDEAIVYWLRREKAFSAEGAARAVRAYRETTANLLVAPVEYNKDHGDDAKPDPSVGGKPDQRPGGQPGAPSGRLPLGDQSVTGLRLEGGTIADVGFRGDPLTREGVDMLIDYFKLLRRALPLTKAQDAVAPVTMDGLEKEHPFRQAAVVNLDTHD